MEKIYLFLAEGFEETEAVSVVDILRRAQLTVETIAVGEDKWVCGAHGITLLSDGLIGETDFTDASWLILPGGMPGTIHLGSNVSLASLLINHAAAGKNIAAICAAPSVLGELGLLKGHKATCYPGFESALKGAIITGDAVTIDLPYITAKGPGSAIAFALAIVLVIKGEKEMAKLKAALCA